MKFFYDTEFIEDGRTIELISIGIVAEDGREYYAVNSDMPVDRIKKHEWLMENVWPGLPTRGWSAKRINSAGSHGVLDMRSILVRPKWVIANEVRDFLQEKDYDVELWADHGAYDHVALAQLWGNMTNLPNHVPMFTHDWQQERRRRGLVEMPERDPSSDDGLPHNALADAHYLKHCFEAHS